MELTTDYDERASLFGYKAASFILGIIVFFGISTVFALTYPNDVHAQVFLPSIIFVIIVLLAFGQMVRPPLGHRHLLPPPPLPPLPLPPLPPLPLPPLPLPLPLPLLLLAPAPPAPAMPAAPPAAAVRADSSNMSHAAARDRGGAPSFGGAGPARRGKR
jgi:hypothetical protein